MKFACPDCQRPIANRGRTKCDYCGAAIPEAMRFTAKQRAGVDRIKADEAKRRKIEKEVWSTDNDGSILHVRYNPPL